MRSSKYVAKMVVLVLVLVMVVVDAQEREVFTFPQPGSILPAETETTITWVPKSPDPITLVLVGPDVELTIADKIPNSGSFTWRIPPHISGLFGLSLIPSNGAPIISESFTIAAGMPPPTPPPGAPKTLIIVTSTLTNTTHTATATKRPPSITDTTLVLDVSTPTALAADPTAPLPPLITTDTVVGGEGPPPAAVIAGATVGAALGAAMIFGAAFWLWRRRREKLREGEISDGEEQRNREMITRGMGAYPGRQFGGPPTVGSQYAASSFGVGSQYAASFRTGGSLTGMEQYAGTGSGGRGNLDEYGRTKGMVNRF